MLASDVFIRLTKLKHIVRHDNVPFFIVLVLADIDISAGKNIEFTMQIYQHLTESMSKQGDDILNKMFNRQREMPAYCFKFCPPLKIW